MEDKEESVEVKQKPRISKGRAKNENRTSRAAKAEDSGKKKEVKPFRPNTFHEFWTYIENSLKESCTTQSTGILNKDAFNRKKKELKPILKDLWVTNAEKRKRFFEMERREERRA